MKPPAKETVQQRRTEIRRRLQDALNPTTLDIIDESHLHAGHEGAKDGRGHFRIVIAAAALTGLPPLEQHRRIYAALGDLMQTDIHAVALQVLTSRVTASK